ncbi:MAG: adenine phosphoribosyltransferase [Bacteroidota bacterium]
MDLAAAVRTVPDFPKPGIQFKDITPLLADADLYAETVRRLADPWKGQGITHVLAMESRGFWFGGALSMQLEAGFVPVRKPGKLPLPGPSETYALEYGEDSLELPSSVLPSGARVLVHDDVIATGGTAGAACRLVAHVGAEVVGVSFVMELAFLEGRSKLPKGIRVESLMVEG